MALPRLFIFGCLALLIGCSPPPGLEAGNRLPPSDLPVELLPLYDLLAQANAGTTDEAAAAALATRAARLRARAAGG
jgi:hypothetical protein